MLAENGVDEADVEMAAQEGTLVLLAIERLVFRNEPKMSTEQMLGMTPLDPERTTELWRSLGFPDPPPHEPFFTDADMEILGVLSDLVEAGATDPELLVQITRVAGQSMARFAAAQVDMLVERAGELTDEVAFQLAAQRGLLDDAPSTWKPGADAVTEQLPMIAIPEIDDEHGFAPVDPEVRRRVADLLLDDPQSLSSVMLVGAVPQLLEYVWRRHMQAAARTRLLHGSGDSDTMLAIGFADLVGFTSLSQQISTADLAEVLDRFERIAYDTVAQFGGRVIKMIGDEVMFSVDDPRRAVDIGMELAATYRDDDELSDVRVGLSWGPVLAREGDCFGPVVNRASRVVNISFPGSVVVSEELYELLSEDEGLHWRSLRRKNLKDIGRLTLWSVQPADDPDHDPEVRDRARVERSERVERAVEKLTSGEVLSKEARQARREALRERRREAEERARKARRDIEERTKEALRHVDEQARRARREVEEKAREAKRELQERTRREIEADNDADEDQ